MNPLEKVLMAAAIIGASASYQGCTELGKEPKANISILAGNGVSLPKDIREAISVYERQYIEPTGTGTYQASCDTLFDKDLGNITRITFYNTQDTIVANMLENQVLNVQDQKETKEKRLTNVKKLKFLIGKDKLDPVYVLVGEHKVGNAIEYEAVIPLYSTGR